jgi:pyruvate-formate lyase-activating enzyme
MRALERKVSTEMKELYGKTMKRQVEIYITLVRKFQVDTERIKELCVYNRKTPSSNTLYFF